MAKREPALNINTPDSEEDPLLPRKKEPVSEKPERPKGIGSRHVLTFLAFLGFINVYTMRVNLSVAMVAMVNTTSQSSSPSRDSNPLPNIPPASIHLLLGQGGSSGHKNGYQAYNEELSLGGENGSCPSPPDWQNSTSQRPGEFNWDEETRGNILGAFFYGYMVAQIPGGWLATRYGGKRVFGLGVLITSALTLITPLAARTSVYMLIAVRVVEGISQGVTFPAMHSMWGVWAPHFERSKLVLFAYAGGDLGTVIALPVSGLLCDSNLAGGWPSVFYIFGSLGVLWTICWMVFVYDSPATHPWISEAERKYIEGSIGKAVNPGRTPWGKIFTSGAVWAIVAGCIAQGWGLYVFLTCLPTYMKEILKFDMRANSSLSALPYVLSWLAKLSGGLTADFIRMNGYLSTQKTRKLFCSLGTFLPAGLVILVGVVGCNHVTAVLTLTLCVGTGGFIAAGIGVNHLDIAPRFSGILLAVSNTFGTIPGFLSPLFVGALTNNNQTRGQWQIVFYVTAAIYVIGACIYLLLGQGEIQPWGVHSSTPVVDPESPAVNNPSTEKIDEEVTDNSERYD